ncbi:unknown [Clostridium sp. CAG:632]|nr:unknown [Clostridium sp. CAG:632]
MMKLSDVGMVPVRLCQRRKERFLSTETAGGRQRKIVSGGRKHE